MEKYGNSSIRINKENNFDSEYLKIFLDEFMKENRVDLLLHSFVNEVIMNEDRIEAVIIQTKNGPVAVKAEVIIDTTGDGDTL